MSDQQTRPEGAQQCDACGNWTQDACTREEAVADYGMELVEEDGEEMLLCEWCL